MKISQYHLIILLVLLILGSGCRKELSIAEWDVDVVAPIAFGSVNFSNYTDTKNFSIDNGKLLHVIASETLLSLGLDTLIGIPDYSIDTGFFIPISISYPPGVPFFVQKEETKFDLKDVELTFVEIRDSKIEVFLENTIDKPVLFTYSIYSATLNGDTFSIEERVEANDTLHRSFNLNGYAMDLRGEDGNGYNTVVTFIQAMIHPDETQNHQFQAGDQFNIQNTVTNVIPEYVVGYFGSQTASFNEIESVDLFDAVPFTRLNVTDFNVEMTIDNGIGADLELKVNQLSSSNKGDRVDLEHSIIGQSMKFTRAINLYDRGNPVKHIQRKVLFTDENSNLDALLENRPDQFFADLFVDVNPLGNVSLGNDFAYYGHNLTASIELDVPLIVSTTGLFLTDTFAFNYLAPKDGNQLDRVNYGSLRFILDNGYAIEARVQFYLMDSLGMQLDSLLVAPTWIAGGTESADGLTVVPARSILEVPVNQARLGLMEAATEIRLETMLNTTGIDSIHVRSDQKMEFKVVADLNVSTQK